MSKVWKAADDRVIVQREARKTQTESGIVIPDKAKDGRIVKGTVLAVGPKARGVKVGDTAYVAVAQSFEVEPGILSVNADFIAALVREEAE